VTPAAEAIGVAAAGAALGGLAGSAAGLAIPVAAVAGLNGAISGARGVYDWRSPKGALAFVLDSTWASPMTFAGLVAHAGGVLRRRAAYSPGLSRRQNRHVYGRGLQLRPGFATTFGNVVCGAGDVSHARRAKLVTDHEDVHVWQGRWFGPLYPALYVGWMVAGGAAGAVVWATRRRGDRFGRVVESCAYYLNPFEWWAYSRDDHWPPHGMVKQFGWRRPAVRSFASRSHGVGGGG
jgi:hypothetical protein